MEHIDWSYHCNGGIHFCFARLPEKTKSGIDTPKQEMDMVKRRLKEPKAAISALLCVVLFQLFAVGCVKFAKIP
jgi:hypothetical protein